MKKNLIYHITPMASYADNLAHLRRYLSVFDGIKLAAVGRLPGADIEQIEAELKSRGWGSIYDWFDVVFIQDNNETIRETATLPVLLKALEERADKSSATFYGHTKGVTHGNDRAIQLWTALCYDKNLSDTKLVETLLKRFCCCGAFKRYGIWKSFPVGSYWHYSGTFYWFNTKDLLLRDWRSAVKLERYGAEAFPGMLWASTEAGVTFCNNSGNCYDYEYLLRILDNDSL